MINYHNEMGNFPNIADKPLLKKRNIKLRNIV